MDNRETPGNKVVRLGLERQIVDYFNAHDMAQVNSYLDVYPYNKPRPDVAVDISHLLHRGHEADLEMFRRAAHDL